jgi:hypothetical protein
VEETMAVRLFRCVSCVACLAVVALFACANSSHAEGFRIETKVFVGEAKEPISETTTLFMDGVVYDFLKKPEQTAVFRKPSGGNPGQFILLNEQRSILTKFSTDQVDGTVTKMKAWASRQKDPFLQFAANPEIDESFDDNTGKLTLASHLENYNVDTMPAEHPDAMFEDREFLDSYTRLNTLLSGGVLQPAPRLRLNAVLARRKVVPIKVELARPGEEPLRAEHAFTWRLSQDDQKRIDEVRENLAKYQEVSNEQFNHDTKPRDKAK